MEKTNKTIENLKARLKKKQEEFDSKFDIHFNEVKNRQGQPYHLSERRSLARKDKQNENLKKLQAEIDKLKEQIEYEQSNLYAKEANYNKLPELFQKLIDQGKLTQWDRYPSTFFVPGIPKARIIYNPEKKQVAHKFISQIKEAGQKKQFAEVYNQLYAYLKNPPIKKSKPMTWNEYIQTLIDLEGKTISVQEIEHLKANIPCGKSELSNEIADAIAGMPDKKLKLKINPELKDKMVAKTRQRVRRSHEACDPCFATWIPVKTIHTDTERFQNRDAEFSQESVDRIVQNYDPVRLDPVVVWKDPKNGKTYMLSGHSRLEAFKQMKLPEIPAKYFEGSEQDAINFAKIEANRLATKESLIEDIKAFKLQRDGDKFINPISLAELKKRWGRDYNRLEQLSHLNPSGLFLKTLSDPILATNTPFLDLRATWTGQLRKDHPKMTNHQEDEIFRWLYMDGSDAYKLVKDEFFVEVEPKVSSLFFDPDAPLGLNKDKPTGLDARIDTALPMKKIREKEAEIKRLNLVLKKGGLTIEARRALEKDIQILYNEKIQLESEVESILKSQGSLFSGSRNHQIPQSVVFQNLFLIAENYNSLKENQNKQLKVYFELNYYDDDKKRIIPDISIYESDKEGNEALICIFEIQTRIPTSKIPLSLEEKFKKYCEGRSCNDKFAVIAYYYKGDNFTTYSKIMKQKASKVENTESIVIGNSKVTHQELNSSEQILSNTYAELNTIKKLLTKLVNKK